MLDISALMIGFYGSVSAKISNFVAVSLPKLLVFFWELLGKIGAWFAAHYIKMLAKFRIRKL